METEEDWDEIPANEQHKEINLIKYYLQYKKAYEAVKDLDTNVGSDEKPTLRSWVDFQKMVMNDPERAKNIVSDYAVKAREVGKGNLDNKKFEYTDLDQEPVPTYDEYKKAAGSFGNLTSREDWDNLLSDREKKELMQTVGIAGRQVWNRP